MSRRNPFKRHRFPREVILLAVRWYCRYPLSCRDVRDMLAERALQLMPRRFTDGCKSLVPKSGSGPKPDTAPAADCKGISAPPRRPATFAGCCCRTAAACRRKRRSMRGAMAIPSTSARPRSTLKL